MAAFLTALGSGATARQILAYLMRQTPALAPKITKALTSGLTAEKVLSFFSKDKNFEKLKQSMEDEYPMEGNANPLVQAQNVRSKNMGNDMASGLQRAAPGALATAGGIGLSMALKHALPTNLSGGASPSTGTSQPQTPPPSPPQSPNPQQQQPVLQLPQQQPGVAQQPPLPQNQPSPSQPPNANSLQTNLAQNANLQQPKGISNDIIADIISKHPQKSQIDALAKSGNGPEEIAAFYQKFNPKVIKEIEKESGKPFTDVMTDYLAKKRDNSGEELDILPEKSTEMPINSGESGANSEDKQRPFNKSEIVLTPNGVGEVKEIRNGQAIVEIDGKKHKMDVDDLEPSDFSEDEIADAYDNLMAKIPEKERSGFISWAGYDEERNVLGFIPRGGKYEELSNITPEEAEKIKTGKGVARTTGETREGLWVSGEDTRGGVISQIIHDRRKKHKESEDKQGKFDLGLEKAEKGDKGTKPLFDEMAYARNLSRERDKKRKLAEKERLKRIKDEEKKRKK